MDPTSNGSVQSDDRGSLQDTLEILGKLATCGKAVDNTHEDNNDDDNNYDYYANNYEDADNDISNIEGNNKSGDENLNNGNTYATWTGRIIGRGSRVRLAYFSVKEYLESQRIIQSPAKDFFLDAGISHEFLAQSCLTYIIHYSSSCEKMLSTRDLRRFPLLRYVVRS